MDVVVTRDLMDKSLRLTNVPSENYPPTRVLQHWRDFEPRLKFTIEVNLTP